MDKIVYKGIGANPFYQEVQRRKRKEKVIRFFIAVAGIVLTTVLASLMYGMLAESMDKSYIQCEEYGQVKYRTVGPGGLFGGLEKVKTQGPVYDGYMQVCVKGKNWRGEVVYP